MNISTPEAEQALEMIKAMVRKTQRRIANTGAYNFLIAWGFIWFFGFLASHFVSNEIVGYVWLSLDILGGLASAVIGIRISRNIRSQTNLASARRITWFWLLLFLYCFSLILVAKPVDGKQMAMIIILFVMIGWIAMATLLSAASVWWGLVITLLALIGYFALPGIFYLWMAVLGGGGMVALGFYIRKKW
jgi:hypothetical protein